MEEYCSLMERMCMEKNTEFSGESPAHVAYETVFHRWDLRGRSVLASFLHISKGAAMTVKTSAIQFQAPGVPVLVDVEAPDPSPGEVRLQMIATSLCNHSEIRSFLGGSREAYGSRYPMHPGEPGHEGVARVVDVGAGVDHLGVGDLVVLTGWGGEPAHRGLLCRDATEVARILPGDRDPAPASILEMYASAYHCVKRIWRDDRVENARVVIIGLGAIGLCALQLVRLWPARALVAIDRRRSKLALAERFGADETLEAGDDAEAVARKVGPAEIVVECTGHPGGQGIARALAPAVQVNVSYVTEEFAVDQSRWFNAETTIFNPGLPRAADLKAVAHLYNRRLIDPAPLVTRRIRPTIAEYRTAIDDIRGGEVVKILMEWGGT
jgi:threonine dehydrogenase-like Zn-dependent dehydrogenase